MMVESADPERSSGREEVEEGKPFVVVVEGGRKARHITALLCDWSEVTWLLGEYVFHIAEE